MKLVLIVCVVTFYATLAAAQDSSNNTRCANGSWGTDCLNACGKCDYAEGATATCNVDTGACGNEVGCLQGYEGDNCDKAMCKQDCGPGICVAPNVCGACGDINLVSPDCEDIRLKGLLGSLIALAVISVSITLCGIGSVYYKRSRNTPVAL